MAIVLIPAPDWFRLHGNSNPWLMGIVVYRADLPYQTEIIQTSGHESHQPMGCFHHLGEAHVSNLKNIDIIK